MSYWARDNQRQRVYDAEDAAGCYEDKLSLREIREFLTTVTADKEFLKRFPLFKGFLLEGGRRKQTRAVGGTRHREGKELCWLQMPPFSRTKMITLHELAHGLINLHHDRREAAGHGPEWCQEYLWMVKRFIGIKQANRLARSFREYRVSRTTKTQLDAARKRLGY